MQRSWDFTLCCQGMLYSSRCFFFLPFSTADTQWYSFCCIYRTPPGSGTYTSVMPKDLRRAKTGDFLWHHQRDPCAPRQGCPTNPPSPGSVMSHGLDLTALWCTFLFLKSKPISSATCRGFFLIGTLLISHYSADGNTLLSFCVRSLLKSKKIKNTSESADI